jgi:hypothetical protein
MVRGMPTRERPADRGRRRAREAWLRLGRDHRLARVSAGISLREEAAATGSSHQQLLRFERGQLTRASIEDVGAWCAAVGLDLGVRAFPAGDPLRDRAQLALLERLRAAVHPSLHWRTEVPLPIEGDLRAWDAVIQGDGWRARVEAETTLDDVQALTRRVSLKLRDDPGGRLILLVADTKRNRASLPALSVGTRELLPLRSRPILAAIRVGAEPPGNGIVMR